MPVFSRVGSKLLLLPFMLTCDIPMTHHTDAGLPYFNRDGVAERISAYRSHATDPLVFTDGGRLVWRVGEGHQPFVEEEEEEEYKPFPPFSPRGRQGRRSTTDRGGGESSTKAGLRPRVFTKCGNQYPSGAAPAAAGAAITSPSKRVVQSEDNAPPPPRQISAVNISTYSWMYTW